jgi:hypothetical protein
MSSSEEEEEVRQAEMERAFAVLDLLGLLGSSCLDMYTQAVRELESIFSNDLFWTRASKHLISSVVDCGMQAIDTCDYDSQWCLDALTAMMNAASKQKALQKTKRSKLFGSFRIAKIMQSRRRKKRDVSDMPQELPSEILALVFQSLDPKSLVQCMLVCREWKEILEIYDEHIWRRHLRITFGNAKADLVPMNSCVFKAFSEYASQFPFMLIPYQTKRIAVQGFVRIVSPSTWNRLISRDRRNDHGLALKAARYPRVPMFLMPDEVVFWLNRPCKNTLVALARQWESLEDRVVHSLGEAQLCESSWSGYQPTGGRFWQQQT